MGNLTRRYFIMETPNVDEGLGLGICIGGDTTQRYNLDETELLIKTTQGSIDTYLSGSTECLGNEYTIKQLKTIISGNTWVEEIE